MMTTTRVWFGIFVFSFNSDPWPWTWKAWKKSVDYPSGYPAFFGYTSRNPTLSKPYFVPDIRRFRLSVQESDSFQAILIRSGYMVFSDIHPGNRLFPSHTYTFRISGLFYIHPGSRLFPSHTYTFRISGLSLISGLFGYSSREPTLSKPYLYFPDIQHFRLSVQTSWAFLEILSGVERRKLWKFIIWLYFQEYLGDQATKSMTNLVMKYYHIFSYATAAVLVALTHLVVVFIRNMLVFINTSTG